MTLSTVTAITYAHRNQQKSGCHGTKDSPRSKIKVEKILSSQSK
jgi:hypothetical protein